VTLTVLKSAIILISATAVSVCGGADDPWAKVRELKSGTEVRIIKKPPKAPVLARFDELTDDNLIVVVRNGQVAIPRDQIDRIDARPAKPGGRVTKETRTSQTNPAAEPPKPGPYAGTGVPGSNTSSSVNYEGKPDFETVYRRAAGGPGSHASAASKETAKPSDQK
jgi:hypothetical protein